MDGAVLVSVVLDGSLSAAYGDGPLVRCRLSVDSAPVQLVVVRGQRQVTCDAASYKV